ncbi:hypothetical protein ABW19_dt0207954 [Dactylella cylindrospora]|nr:hypothetical protein ABW19_dt0207954 [Dactylella cylindrospora]
MEHFFHAIPHLQEHLLKAVAELAQQSRESDANTSDLKERIFELEAGINFIIGHYGQDLSKLKILPSGSITFDLLWTIFCPGMLVYRKNALGDGWVLRVQSCGLQKLQDGSIAYIVDADYIDNDGYKYGYGYDVNIQIRPFPETVPIPSLTIYPFDFHPEREEETARLIKRAEKSMRLQGRHLQEYHGHAMDAKSKKFNSHGRIILDPITCYEFFPSDNLVPYVIVPVPKDKFTTREKLLLSPVLYGFSLGDKVWGAFSVTHLQDVKWNPRIIDALEIPQSNKDFLEGLVRYHGGSKDKEFDDIIRDKGKSLIGLFTGPPGVGKTLTAEVMAEVAEKPLYVLSSGEMGDNSYAVQQSLDRVLELTERWNAVLLLDEADVFLAKRDNNHLARNAITSVFLRKLEYYRGILLLTTNRLESIDEAFQSRIHLCIQYPELDTAARGNIWQTFFKIGSKSGAASLSISQEDKETLFRLNLNGRQIKNIMSIARAYSSAKGQDVTIDTIRHAVEFSKWTAHAAIPLSSDMKTQKSHGFSYSSLAIVLLSIISLLSLSLVLQTAHVSIF